MRIEVRFANEAQRAFYYSTARNQVFSGAFNNGKTFIGCLKAKTLLFTFPNYRMIIGRQTYTDLKRTTMQSFFKDCPSELISSHNEQDGYTLFTNGSAVYWLHLDSVDENTLRGIEVNSYLIDQTEETQEKVFDVLDARLGRWDGAIVPVELLEKYPNWPRNQLTNRPIVPSYGMLLCNPEDEFHYIYRRAHPDSVERDPTYFYVEASWDIQLGSIETYNQALKKDPEWVNKYLKGKWGAAGNAIHNLLKESILSPSDEIITNDGNRVYSINIIEWIKSKGNLFRVLDHGDSSPTCCLWFAAIGNVYICYREYYEPGKLISYHRQAISDLSENEIYSGNYADPQIFKKTAQKDGGFWTVADEYRTGDLSSPALNWIPADNNEFATRNRINELLAFNDRFQHPVTRQRPAPGLYFIQASSEYPYGCKEAIKQLKAQKKKLLGSLNGKNIYSDGRDEGVTDHAYDPTRYFVAMHGSQPHKSSKKPPKNSFAYYNSLLNRSADTPTIASQINEFI